MQVMCAMCREPFEFNEEVVMTNSDGTTYMTVETTVVLIVNAAGDDYDPLFFHRNLCASEWARINNVRLQRPSSFPARYFEAIEQEHDPQLIPQVFDRKPQSDQGVPTIKRSRLA